MKRLLLIIGFALLTSNLRGMNPISPVFNYFANRLDETKAEIKIGELMKETFIENISKDYKVAFSEELTKKIETLGKNFPQKKTKHKKNIQFKVYIIDSSIPDEIPFPGGTLLLTKGLYERLETHEKVEFILARNLIHITKKQPMRLIKRLGIYPTLLNQLKLKPHKRDKAKVLIALKDYLNSIRKLDHFTADREALYLTKSPQDTKESAIELLSSFSANLWPTMPMEAGDIPNRIIKLKELNTNRQ